MTMHLDTEKICTMILSLTRKLTGYPLNRPYTRYRSTSGLQAKGYFVRSSLPVRGSGGRGGKGN
jgi:hypothetical protein